MAISLGFGALFVTLVVLIVVPCLYLVVDALRDLGGAGEASELALAGGE
jgi:hypothetical protein